MKYIFIIILLIIKSNFVYTQDSPECIDNYNLIIRENGELKSYDAQTEDSKNNLKKLSDQVTIIEDELDPHSRKLEVLQFGETEIYYHKSRIESLNILNTQFQLKADNAFPIFIGMETKELRKHFPNAYRNRRNSYSRDGVAFIQLYICHPFSNVRRASDKAIVVSWNKKTQKVIQIKI